MKALETLLLKIAIPFMVVVNLLVIYVGYLAFYPINVVELYDFRSNQDVVRKGEYADFTLMFNKHKDYTLSVKWYLVDGVVLELADGGVRRPLGEQSYTKTVFIPDSPIIQPNKEYFLRAELSYHVLGGLREIKYTWQSNAFYIAE